MLDTPDELDAIVAEAQADAKPDVKGRQPLPQQFTSIPLPPPAPQWRVSIADIADLSTWLLDRLYNKHPHATPQMILSWLRSCMDANGMWFVRSANACALAELVRVPLEPQPIVMEHFVLSRSCLNAYEAADLYPAMASWGAHQNAATLHWERHSDVPRGQFQKRCGGFRQKSFPFIHLGSLD